MRIAFFSPVSPMRSGISDYSEALLRELSQHCEVDLFVNGYRPTDPWIAENLRVTDCMKSDVQRLIPQYDHVLYQMGGTPGHHQYIYELMLRHRGVVTMHDLIYQGFFGDLWLKKGKPDLFVAEMHRSYGPEGEEVGRCLAAGRPLPLETLKRFPMNRRMIATAAGIVVHSRSALSDVEAVNPRVRARLIPHHDFGWADWERQRYDPQTANRMAKSRLGIPLPVKVLACFGFVTATKRPEVVLRAYARLKRDVPDSLLVFVGEEQYRISEYARFLEVEENVRIVGYASPQDFRVYLEAADVCLNLRYPSQGETSGVVLRMLALGKPVVVTNHGWFGELPDDACFKADPDEFEEDLVYQACRKLLSDNAYCGAMGANAHRYVRNSCALPRVALQYLEFLHECAAPATGEVPGATEWDGPGPEPLGTCRTDAHRR